MTISRIVSGGQTGADRGGLEAAIYCDIPHGGWCPKGRLSEDGSIPAKYQLQELPTRDYLARTKANVSDSDCTVVFTFGTLEGGSLKTVGFATKLKKPCLHINLDMLRREQAVKLILKWFQTSCPKDCVLNIAGSRASKSPRLAGVVKAIMVDVISAVNGKYFYPIADNAGEESEDAVPPPKPVDATEFTVPESIAKLLHPKTITEAVDFVLQRLKPDQEDFIRLQPKDKFCGDAHFGMGLWIRNAMIHANENRLDLMADFQRGCREGQWQGEAEPDSVSEVIVGLVWERLQGTAGNSP